MKHILITIVLVSMFNNYPCSYASLCSEHQVDNKVKDKDLRDQANESSNEKKNTSRRKSASSEQFRKRLQEVVNNSKRSSSSGTPMPALPFQKSSTTQSGQTKRTGTKQASGSNKSSRKNNNSNTIEGEWLKRNYQIELIVEQVSADNKKSVFNSKYILSRSHVTYSDQIGYSDRAPIISELEAIISEETEKSDEILMSLVYGVQMPYKSGNYTQFLNVGFTSGVKIKLGKQMTIWENETIKLSIKASDLEDQ